MADQEEDRDPLRELAAAVLRRLRLDGGGRLLDLADPERDRLSACFRVLAVGGLVARGVPREEVRRAERYVPLLVERAFEETGALPEAAAFYALAHEERLAYEDARSRYELAALRFKLGHILFLLGEHEAANLERCAAFGRETAALVERLEASGEGPPQAVRLLAMELQGWLGGRYEALGRLDPAATAFLAASGAAATADDRVAFAARAAAAMLAAGRAPEARRVLDAVRCDLPVVCSDLSRRLWQAAQASLSEDMPGERLPDA
ncbi:MAG TPA: hypothetical protein VF121_12990 [Thermoanaerobaculia bacterium]|nr:hypothetical protein [Thermoanaerobaculia bacterium]